VVDGILEDKERRQKPPGENPPNSPSSWRRMFVGDWSWQCLRPVDFLDLLQMYFVVKDNEKLSTDVKTTHDVCVVAGLGWLSWRLNRLIHELFGLSECLEDDG
jgi:hypothetical protein